MYFSVIWLLFRHSMKKFKELFKDQTKLHVRFSLDNLKLEDDVLNVPLFMADHADRLIGVALKQLAATSEDLS